MAKYNGGNTVKAGFYWNTKNWEITVLSGAGGNLPGTPEERFLKVPMPALLLLGPIMGALFVMFLPFIGFALVFRHLGEKAVKGTVKLVRSIAAAMHLRHRKHAVADGPKATEGKDATPKL